MDRTRVHAHSALGLVMPSTKPGFALPAAQLVWNDETRYGSAGRPPLMT